MTIDGPSEREMERIRAAARELAPEYPFSVQGVVSWLINTAAALRQRGAGDPVADAIQLFGLVAHQSIQLGIMYPLPLTGAMLTGLGVAVRRTDTDPTDP